MSDRYDRRPSEGSPSLTLTRKAGILAAMFGSFVVAWEGGIVFFSLFGRPSVALALSAMLCLLAAAYARRRPVGSLWSRAPYALAVFWALFAVFWEVGSVFVIGIVA